MCLLCPGTLRHGYDTSFTSPSTLQADTGRRNLEETSSEVGAWLFRKRREREEYFLFIQSVSVLVKGARLCKWIIERRHFCVLLPFVCPHEAHIPRTQAQSGRKLRLTLNRTLLDGLIQEDPRQRLYGLDVSRTALTQAIYIL